ncbi:MAG: TPM domain-containing protein [Candidatus Pacebacteria bacterium]|nr:TPM domain-containing protein [Candidatus Paceibacterota bacterium]
MRKYFTLIVICGIFVPISVFAYTSPGKPVGLVNDFAKVLSSADSIALGTKLLNLNKTTGVELAVVTIPGLGDETIETYAVKLFEEWGIGASKTTSQKTGALRDGGILILVAPNDRVARIEVGYGLEGTITDTQASNVVQKMMIPAFKTGNYAQGIDGAVDALSGLIAGDPSVTANYSQTPTRSRSSENSSPFAYFFFGVVILNILAKVLGKTKSWWLGGALGATAGAIIGFIWGFFYLGISAVVILTVLGLIFDYIVSKHPPSGGGGFWPMFFGGGGSGGFGGGGFGGFGGGGSGGGGASGRW